ncbi:MAG: IPTL-CTERM sorting domain-containing protein, partial [Thermodesulfobacteriota bacterium]
IELNTGFTGNEIVDILCPDGELGEGNEFVLTQDRVTISSETFLYDVLGGPDETPACGILQLGVTGIGTQISDQDFENCRQRLIRGCNLNLINPIPTLSQWGMIAMAGVLGIIGLFVAVRRRKAAA